MDGFVIAIFAVLAVVVARHVYKNVKDQKEKGDNVDLDGGAPKEDGSASK
jgi:type III secretory pathway component EscV